jgi:hypothetical protein
MALLRLSEARANAIAVVAPVCLGKAPAAAVNY